MKKTVSLVLALLLLFSTVTVFSACRKKNKNNIETADWREYVVVYNDGGLTLLNDAVGDVLARLEARIGEKPAREATDDGGDVVTDDFEIIIGATDRAATETAKGRIEGNGWCILPVGRKIVIYGTTGLLTVKAVQAFLDAYLPAGGTDAAPSGLTQEVHTDVTEIASETRLVYSTGLDAEVGTVFDDVWYTTDENPDAYDYPVVAARQMRVTVADACGCSETDLRLAKDTAAQKDSEIVVGITTRQISKDLLAELGNVNRYGILIRDGRVAVAGFNDVTLRQAVALFNACIQDGKQSNGTVVLPDDLLLVKEKSNDDWFTDFPQPDYSGLTLTASEDVGQNSVEYYYSGTGVTTANYEDYCAKLTAAGFELYTENTIEGSVYRTYVNEAKKAMLHVTYAAFAHAAEQRVTRYQKAIRIVSSPTGLKPLTQTRLIEKEAFNPIQTFEKITDTRITAMKFDRSEAVDNMGNAYIITLEDGSFIILDGGSSHSGSTDHHRLYRVLRDLYYLAHGYAANETDHRIKLAAWYLSHAHDDHANNFIEFAASYGQKIDAERMIANLCSDSETYNSYNPQSHVRNNITAITGSFKTRMAYYKVRTGWKFYIRNVELEVLFTHEDLCPERLDNFNESSTAIRMTIYNTDGKGNRKIISALGLHQRGKLHSSVPVGIGLYEHQQLGGWAQQGAEVTVVLPGSRQAQLKPRKIVLSHHKRLCAAFYQQVPEFRNVTDYEVGGVKFRGLASCLAGLLVGGHVEGGLQGGLAAEHQAPYGGSVVRHGGIGVDAVARHKYLFGLQAVAQAYAVKHRRIGLAEHYVGPSAGGVLDALLERSAIDQYGRLVGGANAVGIGGYVGHSLGRPPAGPAQARIHQSGVKGHYKHVGAVFGALFARLETGLFELGYH